MSGKHIDGILNLYWFPVGGFAPAMMEHIESIQDYSGYQAYSWNTAHGFPSVLRDYSFAAVNLHYSLFGGPIYWLDEDWIEYLASMEQAFKVAFFQDEYRFWGLRYELLERVSPDLVYTCFRPEWHQATYYKHGWKGKVIYALTGYVGDTMLTSAQRAYRPDHDREIDIGYRARRLEEYMGRGAMEKHEIAEGFLQHTQNGTLALDISTREEDRIYGEDWYEFLGNCRGCLGVEAGVSVVDTEDILWPTWRRMKDQNPDLTFEIFSEATGLEAWEDAVYLRTISPRHFECAAMKCCQILFEGDYSGVMQPGVHYLQLNKDFSNIDSVLDDFMRVECRRELAERAWKDLIDSGLYHYRIFIGGLADELREAGMEPTECRAQRLDAVLSDAKARAVNRIRKTGEWFGPDQFPRPNWPENLVRFKTADPQDILHGRVRA